MLPNTFTWTSGRTHLSALAAAAIKCCAGRIEGQLGVGTEICRDLEAGRCRCLREGDVDVEDVIVGRPYMDKVVKYGQSLKHDRQPQIHPISTPRRVLTACLSAFLT